VSGGVCDGGGHADLRRMGRPLLYRHFSVETLVRATGWMRVMGVDGLIANCQLRWQMRCASGEPPSRGFRALRALRALGASWRASGAAGLGPKKGSGLIAGP
jgi:hypothetical protein